MLAPTPSSPRPLCVRACLCVWVCVCVYVCVCLSACVRVTIRRKDRRMVHVSDAMIVSASPQCQLLRLLDRVYLDSQVDIEYCHTKEGIGVQRVVNDRAGNSFTLRACHDLGFPFKTLTQLHDAGSGRRRFDDDGACDRAPTGCFGRLDPESSEDEEVVGPANGSPTITTPSRKGFAGLLGLKPLQSTHAQPLSLMLFLARFFSSRCSAVFVFTIVVIVLCVFLILLPVFNLIYPNFCILVFVCFLCFVFACLCLLPLLLLLLLFLLLYLLFVFIIVFVLVY
jgi:hypothetical protein